MKVSIRVLSVAFAVSVLVACGATDGTATPPGENPTPTEDFEGYSDPDRCPPLLLFQQPTTTPTSTPPVRATSNFGLWKVDAATGALESQDPVGREIKVYVESECSPDSAPSFLLPTAVPTPTPDLQPTVVPSPTATAVAGDASQARDLLWVYLGRCLTLDPGDLAARLVRDDWFVNASGESSRPYGLWEVDAVTGSLSPQDSFANGLDEYVKSECRANLLPSALRPTPRPTSTPTPRPTPTTTPAPTPTAAPTPTPPPLIRSAEESVATVWSHVVPCFPGVSISDLEARLDPAQQNWVVIEKIGTDPRDFPVWTVEPEEVAISPQNEDARIRNLRIGRGC